MKGNCLTYVAKKLTILVVLTKTKIQINWVGVVFNNLHCKLRNFGDPSKSNMTKDVEFGGAQILDIMLWTWFLVDLNI